MIKCTDAQFSDTSPTNFFRQHQRTKSDEEHEITDPEIMEKLELIMISMRKEASKASSYFEYQKKELETKVNEQSKIISLLEEENNLLSECLEIYVQKYGQLGPEMAKIQKIHLARSQLYNENAINTNDNLLNVKLQSNLKNKSNMSTNYISHCRDSLCSQKYNQDQQKKTSVSEQYSSQSYLIDGQNSTSSNFYKKPRPYLINNDYNNKQPEVRILPFVTKRNSQQMSQISQIQTVQSSILQKFSQSHQKFGQIDALGLESKGQGFFKQSEFYYEQQQDQDETLLIKDSEVQNSNQSNHLFDQGQGFECQDDDGVFDSLKTDSDIKRMRQVLQVKFVNNDFCSTNNQRQANRDCQQILLQLSLNKAEPCKKQLKTLNHSYFKSMNCYQKRTHSNDEIIEQKDHYREQNSNQVQSMRKQLKVVEKKLKALFSPLPSNIASKKISLPKITQDMKIYYARQSANLQKLSELFNPLQTKILKGQIASNKQNRKRTNLNKRIM